jgi:gas vesicle protein
MYREDESGSSFMLGIVTGAVVGAGIALLFAPRSGQEIRQQLGQQYRGLAGRVGEQTSTWREAGRERVQQLRGQLSDRTSGTADRQGSTQDSETGFPSSAPSV